MKPSVSVAMKNLWENGYIEMDDDGYIKLDKGLKITEKYMNGINSLSDWLIKLGVDENTAIEDAEWSMLSVLEQTIKNLSGGKADLK